MLVLTDDAAGKLAQAVKSNRSLVVCDCCVFDGEGDCKTCGIRQRSALEVLIESHIPLVRSLVGRYKVSLEKHDELMSIGLSTLVSCLNKLDELEDVVRIGAYVRRSVGWALHRAISYDNTIYVPVDVSPEDRAASKCCTFNDEFVRDNRVDSSKSFELEETLQVIINNDREMRVLQMLCEGFDGRDIATDLGISVPRVSQIKASIQRKLAETKSEWL